MPGDVVKILGICVMSCCLQCMINSASGVTSGASCASTSDKVKCTEPFTMGSNCINCIICMIALYMMYNASTKNS